MTASVRVSPVDPVRRASPRTRPLRVLIVGPGGFVALERPLRWAIEDGFEVAFADTNPSTESRPGSHRFFHLPGASVARGIGRIAGRRLGETARIPFAAVALRRAASSFRPDVTHVHFLNWRAASCALAGLSPLVVSVWGAVNPPDETFNPGVRHWILPRGVLYRSAAAIVESPAGIEMCRRLAGPSLRVEAIPLGTNTEVFRAPAPGVAEARRRALGISPDDFVFLSPRGLADIYRHERILEAFALARPRIPRRSVLVFVRLSRGAPSSVDNVEAAIRRRAAALGVERDVRWLPVQHYDEMPALYGLCDAVVNYPATDALAATLVEAAACERPIVTARLASYRATFVEKFATLVAPDCPEALADALTGIADGSRAPSAEHLAAARRAVKRECEESRSRSLLANLYRDVVNTSGDSS